jgi:TatD DNase family protein
VTLELIDTHAHLDDDQFENELPALLERAAAAGVARVLTIATTARSSLRCVELADLYPAVLATVGIQPNHVAQEPAAAWNEVVRLAGCARVVAIGETGLDRHWHDTPFDQQEDYFRRHLELARHRQMPVVIHCRKAEADVVRMLRADFDAHGPVRGVMHSFTGDTATAQACLAMGLHLSFAGMLTYKNSQALRAVAGQIPLERLLVETDSPYLAPVPLRGKRNEPANVVHTLTCLADLHRLEPALMAAETTRNARRLFALP